nr:DUF6726 family protein [Noviherbaspirillum sp.]
MAFALLRIMTKSALAALLALLTAATLSGCGVLAAPCRVTSAVIKIVPVVGHAAALPTDACAEVIDP